MKLLLQRQLLDNTKDNLPVLPQKCPSGIFSMADTVLEGRTPLPKNLLLLVTISHLIYLGPRV